jgi:hypothetical protein
MNMKLIKNIVFTSAIVLLGYYSSSAFRFYEQPVPTTTISKWFDYISVDAKAAIKFPAAFEEKKQTSTNGTIFSAKCIRDDDQFMFSANVHAIPFPDAMATIKMIMDNNIRKYGATLVKESNFIYKSYNGKESVFKDMSGVYYYRGVIINNIVYQMLVYTAKEDIMTDVIAFFNSFDYKGPKK